MCIKAYVCVPHMPNTCRGQKKVSGPVEFKQQMVMHHHMGRGYQAQVLGMNSQCSELLSRLPATLLLFLCFLRATKYLLQLNACCMLHNGLYLTANVRDFPYYSCFLLHQKRIFQLNFFIEPPLLLILYIVLLISI